MGYTEDMEKAAEFNTKQDAVADIRGQLQRLVDATILTSAEADTKAAGIVEVAIQRKRIKIGHPELPIPGEEEHPF